MITGAALLAFGGMAHAADVASATPVQTATGSAPHASTAGPIQTLTAAADATADTTSGTQVTEIVVTGSRIPQPNLTSVSPIQAVGHQEFQLEGHTDVIDLLNSLPQNFQNNTEDFSNTTNPLTSPGGISTADLRGLGPQRTLVLVNGRRLGIGDPNTGDTNPAPDLDQIPVALIDHVEVLTGGASSTYGSDAVAGVVNFIMKTDFEGLQLDGTAGIDQHTQHDSTAQGLLSAAGDKIPGDKWDGQNTDFSVIFGANAPDGKGNVTGYFEFKNTDPVLEGDRDYSACDLVKLDSGSLCTGSANSNLFEPTTGPQANTGAFSVVGNQFVNFPAKGSVPPSYFNSNDYEYLSRQDTRYLGGFFAHYDIADWAQPYAEFSFMDDKSHSQIAPSALFLGGGPDNGTYDISCTNPMLSAQEATMLCGAGPYTAGETGSTFIGRRNIEGGGREADFDHTNFRYVLGMKGDLTDAWHYDAYGSYYTTSLYNANSNYLSLANVANALNVVQGPGGLQCASAAAVTAGCVPFNIFAQGGVTQAAENYLLETGTSHGTIEEAIFEGDLTGDLGKYGIKSPWADDGVGLSMGIDNRWDHLVFEPDQAELSGDLSGFGGASVAVNNAISVQEEYFETRVPIAQKQPFAYDLSLEGGYRYSDYSTSGGVSTYKIGGEWAPIQDIRFRASYDRAIRAASIIEAYSPDTVTNTSVVSVDACAPTAAGPATATLAQCERTGVTAAEYGNGGSTDTIKQCPAGQCATLLGGNAALKPEVSDTYSIGATVQPSMLKGFTGSIDYWDIKIAGEISNVPLSTSYQNCLNGVDISTFCPNIVRTGLGNLFGTTIAGGGYIIGTNANLAAAEASGIDFQGDYHLALEDVGVQGMGSLSFHFVGTYQLSNKTQSLVSSPTYDCSGLFGPTCNTFDPVWRHEFRLTWNTPWNILASLSWRYIGSASFDSNSTQPGLAGTFETAFDHVNATLPAVNYLDLAGAWRVNSTLTVRAGVNNILDQDPPTLDDDITGSGSPNTYPSYDLLGRQLFVSATAKF
jgi:iron complex outermembrane recepter protein